jgi:hypothetical protein
LEVDGAEGEVSASAPLLGGVGAAPAGPSSSSISVEEAPGSASKDKRTGKSEKKSDGRKPLVLRCGHAFCDPCITK